MKRLALVAVLLVALAGCSAGSPEARLQSKMNDVTAAANAHDAAALRSALQDFLQEVQAQSANGDITSTKAEKLRSIANRLLLEAGALDKASPAPTTAPPSPSPSPSPSPLPSPSPSPSSPPPSPSPSAPQQSPPSVEVSLSPAGLESSPAASPSPS